MAGSPGAGKTEFSKRFIESLSKYEGLGKTIVRIDADEIRASLPSQLYNGKNAHVVQKAAAKGAHILFDYVSSRHYNFLLDGTFANLPNSIKNIEKLIRKENFLIEIWYIYQDPLIAWDFTKKREALENRRIKKKDFVRGFFDSRENVNTIKKMFPKNIRLNLAIKNCNNDGIEKFELGITNVDHYLKKEYICDELTKMLK